MSELQPLTQTKHVGYSGTTTMFIAEEAPVSPTSIAAVDEKLAELEQSRKTQITALTAALVFCLFYMGCEIVGGYVSHSLAILTDATHLMTDVGAYALSIFALHAASRKACNKYSYGWHRAEVLGTLASVFMIWALVGAIVLEALSRVWAIVDCAEIGYALAKAAAQQQPAQQQQQGGKQHHGTFAPSSPSPLHSTSPSSASACQAIDARMMIVIGVLGMVVNVICACILHFGGTHGHSHFGGGHDHDHGHGHGEDENHGHAHDDHCDHEGHDHGDHEGHDHGDHEGHDHGDHEGHDHGDHEGHDHHGHDHGHHELVNVAFIVKALNSHMYLSCLKKKSKFIMYLRVTQKKIILIYTVLRTIWL